MRITPLEGQSAQEVIESLGENEKIAGVVESNGEVSVVTVAEALGTSRQKGENLLKPSMLLRIPLQALTI